MREQNPQPGSIYKLEDIIETEVTQSLPLLTAALTTRGFIIAAQLTSRDEVKSFFEDIFYPDLVWQEQPLTPDMIVEAVADVKEICLERYWKWKKVGCMIPLVKWTGMVGGENYRAYFNGSDPGICLGLFVGIGPNTKMYI